MKVEDVRPVIEGAFGRGDVAEFVAQIPNLYRAGLIFPEVVALLKNVIETDPHTGREFVAMALEKVRTSRVYCTSGPNCAQIEFPLPRRRVSTTLPYINDGWPDNHTIMCFVFSTCITSLNPDPHHHLSGSLRLQG